jgi:hypothetical protein
MAETPQSELDFRRACWCLQRSRPFLFDAGAVFAVVCAIAGVLEVSGVFYVGIGAGALILFGFGSYFLWLSRRVADSPRERARAHESATRFCGVDASSDDLRETARRWRLGLILVPLGIALAYTLLAVSP